MKELLTGITYFLLAIPAILFIAMWLTPRDGLFHAVMNGLLG